MDFKNFHVLEGEEQWQTVLTQFGWCVGEAALAYVLLVGAKSVRFIYTFRNLMSINRDKFKKIFFV